MEEDSRKLEGARREATETTADRVAMLRRGRRNRESCDGIAELEAELRRAYTAKVLETQIAERETERYVENVRRQRDARLTRHEQQVAREDELRRRSEDLKKSVDYGRYLKGQMTRKEEERRVAMEEARKEREILEEAEREREERERSETLRMKSDLAVKMRRERTMFREAREIRRREEEEAEERKVREDRRYREEMEERSREMRRLKEEQTERRERLMREVASRMINLETRKREREAIISELIAEDVKCELAIREREEAMRRARMRVELAVGLEEQILFTERCKMRYVEQDRAFAEEIMARIMEDERTARLTAIASRRMRSVYRQELAELIEERRRIREREIARMEEDLEEERKLERIRMERVREERKRLLEEHARNVGGFVNKGPLTGEEREIVAKSIRDKRETGDRRDDR